MINFIFGIVISILSFIVGIIIIIKYNCFAGGEGLIGASWILGTLGAPMTFLSLIVDKMGLSGGIISQFIWVCLFYLLQYQLISVLFFKGIINICSKSGIFYIILLSFVILVSAKMMWSIIMGPMGH